jgi:predicted transcriptional regulator
MHLADFWWDANRKPWLSKATLAKRMNLSARHVQRLVAELEQMGLVRRNARQSAAKGKISNEYDLCGLVARLKELAPEFKAADEEAKQKRQAVARPGFRERMPVADDQE